MLVDTQMTYEEGEQIINPAPAGKGYTLEIAAFLVADEGAEDKFLFTSEKGSKMYKVRLRIAAVPKGITGGDVHVGKSMLFNAVLGTGFMAMFRVAYREAFEGKLLDTDVAVGLRAGAVLGVDSYEGVERNVVKKLYPTVG